MKYKNTTDKVMPFKIDGEWKDVLPGETIELGRNAKSVRGLEVIEFEEVSENTGEFISEDKLKNMTKDQLNDYAAGIGLKDEVKSSMTKKAMIELIGGYQSEEA